MRIAVNIGKKQIESDSRYVSLLEGLRLGGCDLRLIESGELLPDDTDVLLSAYSYLHNLYKPTNC